MFTYQIRPRVIKLTTGQAVQFPAECELRFHLQPPQPFGERSDGGRTAIRGVSATALFDSNTGQFSIESGEPLKPLEVELPSGAGLGKLIGSTLTVHQVFDSISELEACISSVFFVLPTLLNVSFSDPPFVERVDGLLGSSPFRWELSEWQMEFRTTTQARQEQTVVESWERLHRLGRIPGSRRVVAALHYFHVACRLSRSGSTAGEFVAEVLLNLAKTLEVLFPPQGDGKSRDAARAGLRALGYTDEVIESDFVPAMALRNEIDVGHVELGMFSLDQLKTIHAYTQICEGAFRGLFERLLSALDSGELPIVKNEPGPPSSDAIKLIKRLKASLAKRGSGKEQRPSNQSTFAPSH